MGSGVRGERGRTAMTMRRGMLVAGSVLAWIAAVACSSQSRPSELGECTPSPGTTCTSGSGSSGGSSDGGVTACEADGGDECDQCGAQNCCSQYVTCEGDTTCANLLSCEDSCTTLACLNSCTNQYPTAVSELQLITSCLNSRCPVCAQSGVGDPCGNGYSACQVGLSCNGEWCTKACSQSSDCTGLGAGGANTVGYPNVCVVTSTSALCTPECTSTSAGCEYFVGSYCGSATAIGNTTVSVCLPPPDASSGQ